ncbi:nuclear transport factor 2 family protein [Pseudohalioglobus sediminis]|uniref:Nuclear transport factor 2 family protein n=1 Tax=Pseudohalioglobus sediminis TaxID=2606449 RepID=A0A5B0X1N5_9GAMM|nr:nuclear transport factor 2 family protein [Pseudohalioglobus sediminis]KAA1193183.1 nuclear transport factor 2 family protein [Pseudohalioglobus sediminis]
MTRLSEQVLRATAERLIAAHQAASISNDWLAFVDELYATDCVYTCEYAGVMNVTANGIEEIKATHYGRDMQVGWEGWTFPYEGVYVGAQNNLVTHWLNRGPGTRADGSYFQTPGVSFITLNSDARISRQFDMFDLAHQMLLCDELEDAGLLSPRLKAEWVLPMKEKLAQQLQRNTS